MIMLKEIAGEIAGMFAANLSLAIIGMVALAAALVAVPGLDPLTAAGCFSWAAAWSS